jgi:hypothetical protein
MGAQKVMTWKLVLSGTYSPGGDTMTPAQLGLDTIDFINVMQIWTADDANYMLAFDLTNNLCYLLGTGAADDAPFGEAAATTVSMTAYIQVYGVA